MAKTIVIFPGGFHPPHAGHVASFNALKDAFPSSEAFMVSTGYTAERPFPFEKKKTLAIAAGIPENSFVEVKSPYVAIEVTNKFDKEKDFLVFGVSEKDADRFTYTKKDGSPGYFQKWAPDIEMVPFVKHAYIYITPILEFKVAGKIVTSASVIRKMYKDADDKTKKIILKDLYPNANLEDVKDLFDEVLKEVYMPKKYRAGLSKTTAGNRKRFWVKLGKYPYTKSEYSKAEKVPGDAKSETRPSQYNKKYQQMFGESRSIKALQKKAKATGIPYGILKQVYNRGMAAWVTGHRPGASQSAWAFARVNSFVTKGKTWRTADADLAKKARKYLAEAHMYDYLDWGWIAPTGEIIAPIESDKTHTSILRRLAEKNKFDLNPLETEYSVTKKGWIRWLVDYDQLMLNTKILLDKITIYKSIERLINKHRNLEGFLFEYEKPQGKLRTISGEKWGLFLNDIKKVYGLEESIKEQKMDYEIEMASGQLKKIVDLATDALNYIQNQSQLDAWMQDKISVSVHNMEAIYDYFHYSEEKIEEKIVKKDKKYYLLSKKTGKNLGGPYDTKEKAGQRERQVQFFKNLNK